MSDSSTDELTEGKFSVILATVKRAKSDNENFASLLIVSKVTKAESLADDKRRLLLRAIGVKFPIRLLATACAEDSEDLSKSSSSFAAIGSSILSIFCSDNELVQENGIEAAAPLLIKTIKIFSRNVEDLAKEIVTDCLTALEGLIHNEASAEKMMEGGAQTLCNLEQRYQKQVGRIIPLFLMKHPSSSWNDPNVLNWVRSLAEDFKTEQGMVKFELCEKLANILAMLPIALRTVFEPFICDVMHGIEDILCSKITEEQRRPSLLLASEVLRLVGIAQIIHCSKKENFIVILTRIACIEIGLFLRDAQDKGQTLFEDKTQLHLLVSCYAITESFCSAIARFEQNETGVGDVLNFDKIRLTQPALADMASSVTEYVSETLTKSENISSNENITFRSSIRMLGSWLNIENNTTSAQGIETLPFVPKMILYLTEKQDWDLIKVLMPVIMLSSDSSETLNMLTNSAILSALHEALHTALAKSDSLFDDEDYTITLHLILQSLLSICSSPNFMHISDFTKDISLIFAEVVTLAGMELPIRTCGYVYPLAAALLKVLPAIVEDDSNVIQKTFQFMFKAHNVSPSDGCLSVNKSYRSAWSEISLLWQACVRHMADCIRKRQCVKEVFLKTEWTKALPSYFEAAKLSKDDEIIELFFYLTESVK